MICGKWRSQQVSESESHWEYLNVTTVAGDIGLSRMALGPRNHLYPVISHKYSLLHQNSPKTCITNVAVPPHRTSGSREVGHLTACDFNLPDIKWECNWGSHLKCKKQEIMWYLTYHLVAVFYLNSISLPHNWLTKPVYLTYFVTTEWKTVDYNLLDFTKWDYYYQKTPSVPFCKVVNSKTPTMYPHYWIIEVKYLLSLQHHPSHLSHLPHQHISLMKHIPPTSSSTATHVSNDVDFISKITLILHTFETI